MFCSPYTEVNDSVGPGAAWTRRSNPRIQKSWMDLVGTTGYFGGGQLSNSMVGKPLGTDAGTSLQRFCFRALGSRSPPPTKATRFSKSSRDRSGGVDKRGSIRSSSGSMGPRRCLRSLATPGRGRIVRAGEGGCIQVITDRILQSREGTVMKKSRLQGHVPQG